MEAAVVWRICRKRERRAEPSEAAEEIYVGLEHIDPQDLHIRRWGKGSDVIGTKLRFRKGDVIFGRRRAYQRKLAVAEFDGICSAHAMVVRAKPDMVLPNFLPFLMMSDRFMKRAVEISVGSLSPTINWTTLTLEEFVLPPLNQQRRLVDMLAAADQAIEGHKKLLQSSCEAIARLRATTIEVRSPSAEYALEDVCEHVVDCPHTTPRFTEDGVLVVRNFNIRDGELDLTTKFFTSEAEWKERVKRLLPQPNDVLFSREAPVGEACLLPPGIRVSLGQRTMLLRADVSKVLPEFLLHAIYSPAIQREMMNLASGTTVPHLNVKDVRRLRLHLPPQATQEVMIHKLKLLSATKSAVNTGIAAAVRLQSSIIDSLFCS